MAKAKNYHVVVLYAEQRYENDYPYARLQILPFSTDAGSGGSAAEDLAGQIRKRFSLTNEVRDTLAVWLTKTIEDEESHGDEPNRLLRLNTKDKHPAIVVMPMTGRDLPDVQQIHVIETTTLKIDPGEYEFGKSKKKQKKPRK